MNTIVNDMGVISLEPSADQRDKEGYFVKYSSGEAAISASATDDVIGVITDGENTDGRSSVAICGGFSGIVKAKLHAAVSQGDFLCLHTDGTLVTDPGSGGRRRVARALEAGEADELINVHLMTPLTLS